MTRFMLAPTGAMFNSSRTYSPADMQQGSGTARDIIQGAPQAKLDIDPAENFQATNTGAASFAETRSTS